MLDFSKLKSWLGMFLIKTNPYQGSLFNKNLIPCSTTSHLLPFFKVEFGHCWLLSIHNIKHILFTDFTLQSESHSIKNISRLDTRPLKSVTNYSSQEHYIPIPISKWHQITSHGTLKQFTTKKEEKKKEKLKTQRGQIFTFSCIF